MKVKCKFSGVIYTTSSFRMSVFQDTILSSHPIMDASTTTLLSYYQDWKEDKLSEIECRLLFIALLKSTDLLTFETPANPPLKIIQSNMEAVFKTLSWLNVVSGAFSLPSYKVTTSNTDLGNVKHWINSLADAKENWSNKNSHTNLRLKMANEEEKLIKLINDTKTATPAFAKRLAAWVMQVCEIPKEKQDYWTSLFLLTEKNLSVYNANTQDLEEMYSFIHAAISDQTISMFSIYTLQHLSLIIEKNSKGLAAGLFGDDEIDLFMAAERNPFKIMRTDEQVLAEIEEPKPLLEAFLKRFDYIKANAVWHLKNEERKAVKERMEKAAKDDLVDRLSQDDFAEIDTEVEEVITALSLQTLNVEKE